VTDTLLHTLPDPDWTAIAAATAPANASRLSFTVRVREAVPDGRMAVHALADLCQEAAARNAAGFGQGLDATMARGVVWVLSRLRIAVRRYPRMGETVHVETWPAGIERRGGVRVHRIGVGDDPAAGAAVSVWSLFDLATRRPVATAEAVLRGVPVGPALLPVPPTVPPVPAEVAHSRDYPVHPALIDVYGHVNHTHLIALCVGDNGTAPGDVTRAFCPRDLLVAFRSEGRPGDTLTVRRDAGAGARIASALSSREDGRVLCRALAWYDPAARPAGGGHDDEAITSA
jgi:acyl-ACP thioesterase